MVTHHGLVGVKGLSEAQVLAEVVDGALQPNRVISAVWSVSDRQPSTPSPSSSRKMLKREVPAFTALTRSSPTKCPFLPRPGRNHLSEDTLLESLVVTEACTPIVKALLERMPSLVPSAFACALYVGDLSACHRLQRISPVAVTLHCCSSDDGDSPMVIDDAPVDPLTETDEAIVSLLLEPPATATKQEAPQSVLAARWPGCLVLPRWVQMILIHVPGRLPTRSIRSIAQRSERLRRAALEPSTLEKALKCHSFAAATMLLRMGARCDPADIPEEALKRAAASPGRRVDEELLEELEKGMPSLGGRIAELRAVQAQSVRRGRWTWTGRRRTTRRRTARRTESLMTTRRATAPTAPK